jgi:exopolyphosphatase / guanosine-5'-triphosphate,3'-diphosphate pyrophosphatase
VNAPRFAAIDIGTNTVLLLVVERRDGELSPLVEHAHVTRLGQGVDRSRRLAPEAVERTLAVLGDHARELASLGVTALDVVGTSALRDAEGAADFVERARALLGVAPRVIGGDEEARLSFGGALSGLPLTPPCTVFDVGGGSTELIVGDGGAAPSGTSVDVGSVRLTERWLAHDPPTDEELNHAREDAHRLLTAAALPARRGPLVGVAGTVTTLAALHAGLDPYDPARVHGSELALDDVRAWIERLARETTARRSGRPGLDPKRADVIVAGAIVVEAVLETLGADRLVVSDRGVRWGLVRQLTES